MLPVHRRRNDLGLYLIPYSNTTAIAHRIQDLRLITSSYGDFVSIIVLDC